MHYIELKTISKNYKSGCESVSVIKNLSFTVNRGEFLAITGPSGCGKSTLLHMIGGLAQPSSGGIYIQGEDLYEKNEHGLALYRRREASIIYQFYNLIPELTAEENLILPAVMNRESIDKEQVNGILDFLGLYSKRNLYPSQLSGGQQQKTAIGRALLCRPSLLLADEPTGSLDTASRDEILELFCYLKKHTSLTILLATHDPAAAKAADSRLQLLDSNRKEKTYL